VPLTQPERKEMNRRGQALFLATGQFVGVLKYVGIALIVVGAIAIITGVFKLIIELAFLGGLMAALGVVCFVATNYFATLAEIVVALLKVELDTSGEAPGGDAPAAIGRSVAHTAPAHAPPPTRATTPPPVVRRPPDELPPIPLAGEEEKPS
jgi:hypothetical protein